MTPTFETESGRVVPTVTAGQMREVDRVAVDTVGLGLLQMMEHAGRNLAEVARETVESIETAESAETAENGRIVVLAGNGGNGGGGICAARHLASGGIDVTVVLDRPEDELSGAAARQRRILAATDAKLVSGGDREIVQYLEEAAVVVDAAVGYGLTGPLRGTVATLIESIPENSRVISLDVPSGIDATTGDAPGLSVDPDMTLILALPKTGLIGLEEDAGDLLLADIGIPHGVYDRLDIDYTDPFDGARRVRLQPADKPD